MNMDRLVCMRMDLEILFHFFVLLYDAQIDLEILFNFFVLLYDAQIVDVHNGLLVFLC